MIAHHFRDTETFLRRAAWRAMLHDTPSRLNPAFQARTERDSLDDWARVMAEMMRPPAAKGGGFYVGYTRVSGQTSLLTPRHHALRELSGYIRLIEGYGTFSASRIHWPKSVRLDRAEAMAFAIWVKGYAIVNYVIGARVGPMEPAILEALRFINAGAGPEGDGVLKRRGPPSDGPSLQWTPLLSPSGHGGVQWRRRGGRFLPSSNEKDGCAASEQRAAGDAGGSRSGHFAIDVAELASGGSRR
jgi:hypothetical protein